MVRSSWVTCYFDDLMLHVIMPFIFQVADKFYSALIKGRPVSSPKVVDVVQKYSAVVDGRMEYIGQGL